MDEQTDESERWWQRVRALRRVLIESSGVRGSLSAFSSKFPTKIPDSYPLTCWDTVQQWEDSTPAWSVALAEGKVAHSDIFASFQLIALLHVFMWFYFMGFSLICYKQVFLKLCGDLTLAPWLWTGFIKRERHDLRAAENPKKILRRGVLAATLQLPFFLQHFMFARISPLTEMISQVRCFFTCVCDAVGAV